MVEYFQDKLELPHFLKDWYAVKYFTYFFFFGWAKLRRHLRQEETYHVKTWHILLGMFVCVLIISHVQLFYSETIACQALCHEVLPGRILGGLFQLSTGIFPIQELNPGLLHCRQDSLSEPPRKKYLHG